jgi:hypothetical protein
LFEPVAPPDFVAVGLVGSKRPVHCVPKSWAIKSGQPGQVNKAGYIGTGWELPSQVQLDQVAFARRGTTESLPSRFVKVVSV